GASSRIVVKTAGGDALDAIISPRTSAVALTYVTTSEDRRSLLVHLRNSGASPRKVQELIALGRDVLASDVACVPDRVLSPGATALFVVPLCEAIPLGAAWTVVAELDDGGTAVGVGRVVRPYFPIESWPNSSDCPFPGPGAKTANYERHVKAGFDSALMYVGGVGEGCTHDPLKIVNEIAPASKTFFPFLSDDFLSRTDWKTVITDRSQVAGFLLGDEVDGSIYTSGKSNAAGKADKARRLWDAYPELATYIGSKTNRNVGAFAGAADIQGSDFYVAACAPHITAFGAHPPIVAAYDYLRNTRDNHMPLPTWLYAQGLSPAWNKKSVLGTEIVSQPDPQEILVQAYSAVAAGAKGVMWFQTNQAEALRVPGRWDAIASANWTIRGVRDFLRTGDPIGGARVGGGEAIVEAIRAEDAIVVPVIGTKSTKAPEDLGCQSALVGVGAVPHWELATQTLDVSIDVPPDFGVATVLEVTPKGVSIVAGVEVSGRTIKLVGVRVDNTQPARLFVLARTTGVRTKIEAALAR
ncbi:MAG: hypothetical protein ABI175_04425, partial [Polyangiales bacterium]